jgi:hypothetical protein
VDLDRQAGLLAHHAHHVLDCFGQRAAHRVDNADGIRRALVHDRVEQAGQVFLARTRGVVGEEHGVQAALFRILDRVLALLEHVFPGPLELVFQFRVADRDFDDDAVSLAVDRGIHVGLHRAREREDLGLQAHAADLLDRLVVVG